LHQAKFENSQANSQLRYSSLTTGKQRIFSVCLYFSLRLFSRLWIFFASPFIDSNISVENLLENTQKFYDGGARLFFFYWSFAKQALAYTISRETKTQYAGDIVTLWMDIKMMWKLKSSCLSWSLSCHLCSIRYRSMNICI
jgi:hypothetical protein